MRSGLAVWAGKYVIKAIRIAWQEKNVIIRYAARLRFKVCYAGKCWLGYAGAEKQSRALHGLYMGLQRYNRL